MPRYLQVKEIDTLAGNPNTAALDAPLGQPLIDRETGALYTKRNALGSATPTWGRIDQVENVQAGGLGATRALSTRLFEFGVNALDWCEGDGSSDDTEAFGLMLSLIASKSTVFIPAGTYVINTLTVSKDISLRGINRGQVIFKHKASATGHMVKFTTACSGTISGITFDGNSANQDKATSFHTDNRYSLLYFFSNGARIHDCTFRDFMYAGILDYQSSENLTIEHCRFENGYSLLDTDLYANCGLRFAPTGGAPKVTVRSCWFENDSAPASGYKACGGVIFANGSGYYNAVVVDDCDFIRVGDDATVGSTHYGIAAIDLYESTLNATITNNRINTYYIGLKLQNTQNLYCSGNFVTTTYTLAIDYCPGERLQAAEFENAKIIGNTVYASAEVGIYIRAGFSGGWKDVVVSGNTIKNSPYGIRVEGRTDNLLANEGFGPVLIQGNQIWNTTVGLTSGNGIDFQYTQGDFKVLDNYINSTGGNAITASSNNSASTFTIRGNTAVANTTGYRCVRFLGVKTLSVTENTCTAATAGDVALEVDGDGSGNPVEILTERGNILIRGTKSIDYSDVRRVETQSRVVAHDFTVGQNVGASETDLCSLTIPKYTLNENGQSIEFTAAGLIVGSANNKRIKVYLGSTVIYDSLSYAAAAGFDWNLRGVITRVNATAQNAFVQINTGAAWTTVPTDYTTNTETLTNDLTFKITGQGGADNEVALGFVKLEFKAVP